MKLEDALALLFGLGFLAMALGSSGEKAQAQTETEAQTVSAIVRNIATTSNPVVTLATPPAVPYVPLLSTVHLLPTTPEAPYTTPSTSAPAYGIGATPPSTGGSVMGGITQAQLADMQFSQAQTAAYEVAQGNAWAANPGLVTQPKSTKLPSNLPTRR